jgi:hypothetical protein
MAGVKKTRKVGNGSYIIAIPSYKRAETLRDKSLAMLADAGISASIIHVFVATEAEKETYRSVLKPGTYGKLVVAEPGMGAVRNFITRYFPIGKKIMNIDDDIKEFKMLSNGGLKPVRSLDKIFRDGFAEASKTGFRLFGFYPVANGFFMHDRVTQDLRYIIGSAWGIINPGIDVLKVTLDDKEDVQRSIIMYLVDGGVLRYEMIAPITAYYKEPGGMQEERTKNRVDKSAHAMVAAYPGLAKINLSKKSGFAEVRLRDQRDEKTFGLDVLKTFKPPVVSK